MTASLPAAELRALLPDDEKLLDEVHQRILSAGAAAVPGLLELAREELESVRADTESVLGFRANHAVKLLGELKAVEAVPVLLDLVEACDPDLMLFNDALFAAIAVGPAAGEACLVRWERVPEHRYALAQILTESGLRDERVYQRFLELLDEDPMLGAMALGDYGEARAIEPLRRRLARLDLDDEHVEPDSVIELAGALKHLGAELTEAEQEKWDTAAELRRALAEGEPLEEELEPQEPVRAVPRPGRNDPCWCGSGKKYKKCHDPELPPAS